LEKENQGGNWRTQAIKTEYVCVYHMYVLTDSFGDNEDTNNVWE